MYHYVFSFNHHIHWQFLNTMHTCQPFENFMGEKARKWPFLKAFFKQSCMCFKSYDNFHGGDVWILFYDLKEKS